METNDFIIIAQKVALQTYRNEKLKQMELRKSYRIRLRVNQIGIRKYVDNIVQEFENTIKISKGADG